MRFYASVWASLPRAPRHNCWPHIVQAPGDDWPAWLKLLVFPWVSAILVIIVGIAAIVVILKIILDILVVVVVVVVVVAVVVVAAAAAVVLAVVLARIVFGSFLHISAEWLLYHSCW